MLHHSRRSKACDPCRAKKVKCDEGQPECLRCRRAGKACSGPVVGSIFINNRPLEKKVKSKRLEQLSSQKHVDNSHPPAENSLECERRVAMASSPPRIENACLSPRKDTYSDEVPETAETSITTVVHNSVSYVRFLGGEMTDPFSTMARAMTPRENFLANFYVHEIMPAVYYGSRDALFDPNRDTCFGIIMQGVAAMEVMFEFAARHVSRIYGLPDTEARSYRVLGVRRLNEAISNPSQRFLDSTIITVLGYINILYQLQGGSRGKLTLEQQYEGIGHFRGIRHLINGRGGFTALSNSTALYWILVITDLLSFGEISAGCTPLSPHAFLQPGHTASPTIPALLSWSNPLEGPYNYPPGILVAEYTGAFCDFFREAQTRKEKCLLMTPESSAYHAISQLFSPGVHLYRLVKSSPEVGFCRVCVLFVLNIILWDHRDNLLSLVSGFFKDLRIRMVHNGLDLAGCTDLFLFTLVTTPEAARIQCPEQLWLAARLLRIHARLSNHLQAQVECALQNFILAEDTVRPCPFSLETFHSVVMYDLDRLGNDIFSARGAGGAL